MKQTAVEWLFEQVVNRTERVYFLKELEQAKEMEKQQLYNFYVQGGIDCVTQVDRTVEDFYKETFKSE
jgi:hypothetical protein